MAKPSYGKPQAGTGATVTTRMIPPMSGANGLSGRPTVRQRAVRHPAPTYAPATVHPNKPPNRRVK